MKSQFIGIDLGGTNLRTGLMEEGKLLDIKSEHINSKADDPNEVIDQIIRQIESVITPEVAGIGIGVPSLVDQEKGIVYDVQNIPAWKEVYLSQQIEETFGRKVRLNNDANCFALGEKQYGKGENFNNMVGAVIGTGFGVGIVNRGYLLQSLLAGSGEYGCIPYKDGILEDYCSGSFFKNTYNQTGEELYQKACKNDTRAQEIFNEFGRHLGTALKIIIFTLSPELIVLGGSVVKSRYYFEDAMYKELEDFPYQVSLKQIHIEYSETSNVNILGAASLCYF